MRHVVAISGGKDSTAMALRLREVEPAIDFDYLITPTGNELPELEEHWSRLESLIGKPFVRLKPFTEGDGLEYLIDFWKALPNGRMRWCTRMLKIRPTIEWLKTHAPCVQYVGLRADEETREGIYGNYPGIEQRYPFREWGWGIEHVVGYLAERGVAVPKRTDCAWCYDQRLVEWYWLWRYWPDLYARAEAWEAKTGYTFRSATRDTWPADLAGLRAEFERGRKPRGAERTPSLFGPEAESQACRVCRL